MAQPAGPRGSTLVLLLNGTVGAYMARHPLPSLALIAFDAKRKAEARAKAERQRQLFLEPVDPRYWLDPRLMRAAEDDE